MIADKSKNNERIYHFNDSVIPERYRILAIDAIGCAYGQLIRNTNYITPFADIPDMIRGCYLGAVIHEEVKPKIPVASNDTDADLTVMGTSLFPTLVDAIGGEIAKLIARDHITPAEGMLVAAWAQYILMVTPEKECPTWVIQEGVTLHRDRDCPDQTLARYKAIVDLSNPGNSRVEDAGEVVSMTDDHETLCDATDEPGRLIIRTPEEEAARIAGASDSSSPATDEEINTSKRFLRPDPDRIAETSDKSHGTEVLASKDRVTGADQNPCGYGSVEQAES